MHTVALYVGSAIVAVWGIAHLVSTGVVLEGFGVLERDTRHVVTMEWIMEGLMLTLIAALVVAFTAVTELRGAAVFVFRTCAVTLVVMAVVSVFTGARASFWVYKACPVVFSVAAGLFVVGSFGV